MSPSGTSTSSSRQLNICALMSLALPVSGSSELIFLIRILQTTQTLNHKYLQPLHTPPHFQCVPLRCIYNIMLSEILLLFLAAASLQYQIINAFNCGSQNVLQSPIVKYTSDEMYQGLTSKSVKKDTLPSQYIDPIDMQLLSTERTTEGPAFSYYLRLKGPDQYLLMFKFIEVKYEAAQQRVFQVKLGDQVALEVDIVAEVGVGEVLHKCIEFDLRDEVLFINGTLPVLNGYIYPKQLMKLTFNRIRGQPKIQALILIKGSDRLKFLNEYLQYQKSKNKNAKEYISQKYHKPIKFPYKHMTGHESFSYPQQNLWFYLKKVFSLNTLFSIIAVSFVVLHEKIYEKLNIPKEERKNE